MFDGRHTLTDTFMIRPVVFSLICLDLFQLIRVQQKCIDENNQFIHKYNGLGIYSAARLPGGVCAAVGAGVGDADRSVRRE